jgi:hypothetical protein
MTGSSINYNIVMNNCHQLTAGCITGEFDNPNNFFWFVEQTIAKEMNNDSEIEWRVWDL